LTDGIDGKTFKELIKEGIYENEDFDEAAQLPHSHGHKREKYLIGSKA